ncbi:hypothetical protein PIROE2DRAFT_8853, partial [Piromyces sp. E2]
YECLCRTLAKYAKTTSQMKLLWSSILKKVENKLEFITTPLVIKVWKEISSNKQYSHICHFEDDIMSKFEKFSTNKQLKRIQMNNTNNYNNNSNSDSTYVYQYNSISNSYSYSNTSTSSINTTSNSASNIVVVYPNTNYNISNNYYSPVNNSYFVTQSIIPQNTTTTMNQQINNSFIPVSMPLSPNCQFNKPFTTNNNNNQVMNTTSEYSNVQSNTVESVNNKYIYR